jgi:hypothetical protein
LLSHHKTINKQMKKIFLKLMLLALVGVTITSCEKDINNWDVDPSHQRLFKSLTFDVVQAKATTVELKYTRSVSANKYIFEFSKDSLQFSEIVKSVEILADTLTAFANSTTPTKVEYRTIFDELDGASGYSVRMKSIDTIAGTESKYSQLYFETAAEQLFTGWDVFTDHINIKWTPTNKVTHISVFDAVTLVEVQKNILTPAEIADGKAELTNLSPGTNYIVSIFNNDIVRGTKVLKTSGLQGGIIIHVNPGDDIPALLSDAISQGKPNVTLIFKGGETYDLSTAALMLPAGLSNISFTGERATDGSLPTLKLKEVRLSDVIFGKVLFEKVNLTGGTGDYLINLATDGVEIEEYVFTGCLISNYRGTVRVQNKNVKLQKITFNDTRIQNTGDYGIINIGGATPTVDSISFKNSTMREIASQLMDVRTKVKGMFVGNCTFYNETRALTQLVRLDKNNLPSSFEAPNNIIAGSNSGAELKSFSLAYDAGTFAGSYRTNEMAIKQEFPNITVFQGSAVDLFVDPANGDFTVKPESGFGGRGTAGDPRWFE